MTTREHAEKENIQSNTSIKATPKQASREFPSTPAGRIPLSELIDNTEDPGEAPPPGSPVEAVSWNKSPDGTDPTASFMTPMVNRKRKRARNSPREGLNKRQIERPSLSANLKTPRNDPTLDLESRFFGFKHRTPSKPASSAAPDFMHSSSPQTPGPPVVDSAKLKRTRSLGITAFSGPKRRKLAEEIDFTPAAQVRSVTQNNGEMQQIREMLDSIHEDLPGSLRISQFSPPSGIVPSASMEDVDKVETTSFDASAAQSQLPNVQDTEDLTGSPCVAKVDQRIQASDEDFGDLDDALADLDDIEATAVVQDIHGESKVEKATQTNSLAVGSARQQLPTINAMTTNHQENFEDDDFDEFVDDEGLEILASLCDSGTTQPSAPLPRQIEAASLSTTNSMQDISKPKENIQTVIDISDDEFNDGIDDDFCDGLYAATQGEPGDSFTPNPKSTLQRYVIVSASDGSYATASGAKRPEKVLHLEDKKRASTKAALLRDSWIEGSYPDGCVVHILGDFDSQGHCIIDNKNNWIIVHPDHLVSATVVADSFGCTRRAVLQDRVKATSGATEPLVYGHILHEVFQEGMKANRWDNEWLEATITTVCSRYLENLYEINVEVPMAINNLMNKAAGLQNWAQLFVSSKPQPEARVIDRGRGSVLMSINKLLEVEEHIWSPKFGLKGNIDATVQVTVDENGEQKTLTVPLELKTGKNTSNVSHQAQTALYTLLLSDRYDVEVIHGILFYLESSATSRITGVRGEVINMIQQRNKIATYVRRRETLPPMLQDSRMCGRCYAKPSCFVYHKLVEDGNGKTSGLQEEFTRLVHHLKPIHKEFFMKWDSLLSKEETDAYRFRKELWTMLSSEREKVGRCFGGLVIDMSLSEAMPDAPKINRYKYTLVKQKQVARFSFTESQITVGEPIVISDENEHYALANGYVTSVRPNRITVLVDRRLQNFRSRSKNFDAINNQSFSGIMQVKRRQGSTPSQQTQDDPVVYRLDKDEFSNGMATVRNNLIRLMDSDSFGSETLRQLVVENKKPLFEAPKGVADWLSGSQASLNIDQQNAVAKVMSARNYALVLGMPGTGKTTTIAHIIRALVAKGKSVLLTSYTHTAVDNILLKIRNDNISILRLGAIAKLHPEIQGFADLASEPKKSFEELKKSYSAQVVATTCLGINHAIFNSRIFDFCIVDEASQITLPVCLGPIAMAKRFVLVGDHYQLPPLVQNKEAQEGGLDVSLFKLLSDAHPQSVVNLEHQYRMCEDIMSLSNTLIYSGRLKCGTPGVASSSMSIPNMAALKLHHHDQDTMSQSQNTLCTGPTLGSCWLRETLDPSRKVIFLNTDLVGSSAQEIVSGTRVTNPFEVTITTQTVEALLAVGIPATDIGVITLYRSQLSLLKHSLRHISPSSYTNPSTSAVEMHTADKFQGRDKHAVVLSLVRSNDNGSIGDLLQDWRRVNVALTRARTKLIIIGSEKTIRRGTELLDRLCAMCRDKGWMWDLKGGDAQSHVWEEWRTQTPATLLQPAPAAQRIEEQETAAPESDIEVGSAGKSPVKKTPLARKTMGGYVNKPFKQVTFAGVRKGQTDVRRLLSKRAVLTDIINDAVGLAEE